MRGVDGKEATVQWWYFGQGRLKRYKRGMDRKSYVDRRELRRLLAYRVDKLRGKKG